VAPETIASFAPGRVNIIGDHTDTTGGWCLPIAIQRGVRVIGTREPATRRVFLTSDQEPDAADVALDVADPAIVEPPWARYVAGVVSVLRPGSGFRGKVSSTLPVGVGLSSSAALEVAVALAIGGDRGDPVALARQCQAAEHAARGVPTGILDQISSICGRAGHALLLDCDQAAVTPVALPPADEVEWVVVLPSTNRDLGTSAYGERVAELRRAEAAIGPLRAATIADVDQIDDPAVRARARHVVSENRRVHEFVAAIRAGDVHEAGRLMSASHVSLSRDYDSSLPSIDAACRDLLALDGVLGARITGGGWGGALIALTRPGVLAEQPGTWIVTPSNGATLQPLPRGAPG
jgi:galactokinase